MNRYIITEEDICTIRDYVLGAFYEGENKEKIYDLLESQFSVMRSHPYQSERDCPVCGGGLMCHRWCIDRDCGWDSVKGTPAGRLTMNHPGFALNSIKRTGARLKALRERRKHIENQIEELRDKLYIIDGEIVALGTV